MALQRGGLRVQHSTLSEAAAAAHQAAAASAEAASAASAAASKPHLVIVLADDLGYNDMAFNQNEPRNPPRNADVTANVTALAREGIILVRS